MPNERYPGNSNYDPARYVDGQRGWRAFFFLVAFACVCGLAFRLILNPDRIKSWIIDGLAQQSTTVDIRFQAAFFRLAKGSMPAFAIELKEVDVFPSRECSLRAGIHINSFWLPLRVASLFEGRPRAGTLEAEKVDVDIDAMKARCPERVSQSTKSANSAETPKLKPSTPLRSRHAASITPGKPWWTPEQYTEFTRLIRGIRIHDVDIFFEGGSKKVSLSDLQLKAVKPSSQQVAGALSFNADVRIPPEIVFQEKVPELTVEALITANEAKATVSAPVSEGSLIATGHFAPAGGDELETEMKIAIRDVPLSTLIPLVTKSGVVSGAFNPKFMWLKCSAMVRGRFQGLLTENPLILEDCEIAGGGGSKISVSKATRRPDGSWEPFQVAIADFEISRLNETFDWHGPDGVFGNYGRLSGLAEISGSEKGRLKADIAGAQVRVVSRNVQALQKIDHLRAEIEVDGGSLKGNVPSIELSGGKFEGELSFNLTRGNAGQGRAEARVSTLRLSPESEKVLFQGQMANIDGRADARFLQGKLAGLTGSFGFHQLAGEDFKFEEMRAQLDFDPKRGEILVNLRTPKFEIGKNSWILQAVRPLFFMHEFDGDWQDIRSFSAKTRFIRGGGWRWENALLQMESGRVHVASNGGIDREHEIDGWVSVDFPQLKKLKWKLEGRLDSVEFKEDAAIFESLRDRKLIDDRVLGLAREKSGG